MKKIGFANKFYTLWDVTNEPLFTTVRTANGDQSYRSGTRYNCVYIKNVSIDLEKVLKLYPNIPIDETLRGKSKSFEWAEGDQRLEYANDVFSTGYSKGNAIDDCRDFRCLSWAWDNDRGQDRKNNIERALNNIGAYVYNGSVYESKELMQAEIDREIDRDANKLRIDNVYKSMISGGVVKVNMERNLSAFGTIFIDGILYKFNDYIVGYYNGYGYGMPSYGGKGKRVKGKEIELVVKTGIFTHPEYGVIENCLIVESFKILKQTKSNL